MTDTFADQLKSARKAAGLTQHALAEYTEIPLRTIEDWERGKMTPPPYVQRLVLKEIERMKK